MGFIVKLAYISMHCHTHNIVFLNAVSQNTNYDPQRYRQTDGRIDERHDHANRRSVINPRGPNTSLPPSILSPSLSWTLQGFGQSPLTRCQIFWCNLYTDEKPYKIHADVWCTTEISVHAEFSHCRQYWYYGLQFAGYV